MQCGVASLKPTSSRNPEDIFVYGLDVGVFQRPVTAPFLAGMNGFERVVQGRATQRPTRFSSTGLSCH